MEIYETRHENEPNHHWLLSLVLLTLVVFGALALLQGLAVLLIPPLFDVPLDDLFSLLTGSSNHPNARLAFLFLQGLGGGLGFILGGYIFIQWIDKASLNWARQFSRVLPGSLALVFPILGGFILFNSLIIFFNLNIEFPAFLEGLEQSLKSKEKELLELTLYLTDFNNSLEFLAGLVVIGILPGIGEEYLFRGILQPKLQNFTNNAHIGIWLAAFVFSAIHLQFYGFLPRMLLGALFGYLYHYSGSLVYPMLAHLLNNSFIVCMVYFNKLGWVDFDMTETERLDWLAVIIGLVVFIICFGLFKKSNRENERLAESF